MFRSDRNLLPTFLVSSKFVLCGFGQSLANNNRRPGRCESIQASHLSIIKTSVFCVLCGSSTSHFRNQVVPEYREIEKGRERGKKRKNAISFFNIYRGIFSKRHDSATIYDVPVIKTQVAKINEMTIYDNAEIGLD